MCFDTDSVPPVPAISGAAVEHRDLILTASDGNSFAAFEAWGGGGAGVLILPDVRGLYRFYEELALRFAERGHHAIAIDYFGRTAGVGKRGDDFDYWPEVRATTFDGVRADTSAAVDHLRVADRDRPVVTVGFCFGGSNSWHQAANGLGLAGAIGFYGHPDRAGFPIGAAAVVERLDEISCPILALQAGDDAGIPVEVSRRFGAAMTGAGIRNEVVVYPGAPHSFFDRKQEDFAEASADAWRRCLDFIETVST